LALVVYGINNTREENQLTKKTANTSCRYDGIKPL